MKEFKFQNVVFSINAAEENFAEENRINEKMREEAEHELRNIYDSYEKMDVAMEKLTEDMLKIFAKMADRYVSAWNNKGYYDLDIAHFINHYYLEKWNEELCIEAAYYNLEEKYTDIVMTQEQKAEYRQLRKESRGRWIGGGFGLSGAIKGAATAGAVNIVTGLGHSIFNAVGNLATSIATNSKKAKLYKESLDMLICAIREDVSNLMYANMLYAKEKENVSYQVPTVEDCRKVSTILQNWKQRKINLQQRESLIAELFELNPYDEELYECFLDDYGDSKKELQNIADFFGKGKSLELYKMKKFAKAYMDNPKETWRDYKTLQAKLEDVINQYGIHKNKEVYEFLDIVKEGYEELYREACTYNNVVYESPEDVEKAKYKEKCIFDGVEYKSPSDAQTAKNEKKEIDTIRSNIKSLNFESVEKALQHLRSLNIRFYQEGYISAKKETEEQLKEMELKQLQEKASMIDEYDLNSIKDMLETIQNTETKYCNKERIIKSLQKKIDNFAQSSKIFYGYDCESNEEAANARALLSSSIALIEKGDFQNAIKEVHKCSNLELQKIIMKQVQIKASDKLGNDVRLANSIDNLKSEAGEAIVGLIISSIIIGIVGLIAINFLPAILVGIGVIIAAIYVIVTALRDIGEALLESMEKKNSRRKLEKLNTYGYGFKIKK